MSDDGELVPLATLERATQRFSAHYSHIVFNTSDEDEEEAPSDAADDSREETTISWPPTAPRPAADESALAKPDRTLEASEQSSVLDRSGLSTTNKAAELPNERSVLEDSEDSSRLSASRSYDASGSIALFPAFAFSPHVLRPLGIAAARASVLVGVFEVDGPSVVRLARGPDAGSTVSVLRIVVGDTTGAVGRISAWREVADIWGGMADRPGVRRGDVVLLENVAIALPAGTPTLTASPRLRSDLRICYRTLPTSHEDRVLRPDLRLAHIDAAFRLVASLAAWMERMAGLA